MITHTLAEVLTCVDTLAFVFFLNVDIIFLLIGVVVIGGAGVLLQV